MQSISGFGQRPVGSVDSGLNDQGVRRPIDNAFRRLLAVAWRLVPDAPGEAENRVLQDERAVALVRWLGAIATLPVVPFIPVPRPEAVYGIIVFALCYN